MSKQIINTGASANDRNGDPLRTAFSKINSNFTELYSAIGADNSPDRLISGSQTVILGTDGTVTFPDDLTVANGVIGKATTDTTVTEDLAGTTTATHTVESQIEIATTGIVIAKRIIDTLDDGVITATDNRGSVLELTESVASIKQYADPAGPNNIVYSQFTTDGGAIIESIEEDVGSITYGRVNATRGAVQVSTSNTGMVNNQWQFDGNGTLTVPATFPRAFTAVLDTEHMSTPSPAVALTDAPWTMGVTFSIFEGGLLTEVEQIFPIVGNPGYVSGYAFTFTEADHGIPGYTLDLELQDVILPGGAGWTANIAVSAPPALPASLTSPQALVLHGDTSVVIANGHGIHEEKFRFEGRNLILPGNGDIRDYLGNSVLGGPANELINGDFSVVLGSDGKLTLPNLGTINNTGSSSSGILYTFNSDENSSISNLTNSTKIYLVDNSQAETVSVGWIITFANSETRIVTDSGTGMAPHTGWALTWADPLTIANGSDVWPITVQSSDYSVGSSSALELTPDGTTTWTLSSDGVLSLPIGGDIQIDGQTVLGAGGLSVSGFGEGFSLNGANKIVTNKLYSTNLTQPTQHYRLELDTNGVVHLPDQSIINGATLKSVAGNYAGITAGPIGKDEDSWMWVDSDGSWIATDYSDNAYTWHFDNTGALTMPLNGDTLLNYGHLYFGDYGVGTNMFVDSQTYDLQIYTNTSGQRAGNWIFKNNGDTVLPGNINSANEIDVKIGTGVYNSSANSLSDSGTHLHIAKVVDPAIGEIVKPGWQISTSWGGHIAKVIVIAEGTGSFGDEWIFIINRDISAGFVGGGQVTFGIPESTWTFAHDGNLTLPVGGDIVDSTGETVLGFAASYYSGYTVLLSYEDGHITVTGDVTTAFSSGQIIKFSILTEDEYTVDTVAYDSVNDWTAITLVEGLGGPVDNEPILFEKYNISEIYPGEGIQSTLMNNVLTLSALPQRLLNNNYQVILDETGILTIPGDIRGPATYDPFGDLSGHTLSITPASDAPTKKFNFRIDQFGQPFTRAYLDMPQAEVDHQVGINFPHDNGTSGSIFTQGANTYDDGMNNAFNIFYNHGDIKITTETSEGVLKTWKFGNDGILTLPAVGAQIASDVTFTGAITFQNPVTYTQSTNMPNRPAFRVVGNGGQIASVTTMTSSNWTVDFQQGSALNGTTGIFTAPLAGLYQVNLVVRAYTNSGVTAQVICRKTTAVGSVVTTAIMVEWAANTTMNHTGGSTIIKLAAGDTLKLDVTLGSISFDGNDNWSVAYIG